MRLDCKSSQVGGKSVLQPIGVLPQYSPARHMGESLLGCQRSSPGREALRCTKILILVQAEVRGDEIGVGERSLSVWRRVVRIGGNRLLKQGACGEPLARAWILRANNRAPLCKQARSLVARRRR